MATFSYGGTAKQFYVAKSLVSSFTPATAQGAIDTGKGDGCIYFLWNGADGVTRSDLIRVANILSAKATKASTLKRGLVKQSITLDSEVNSGAPLAGQDYILDIIFYEFGSQSYEEQYLKQAAVRATTGMSADTFYRKLITSLRNNFSRESVEYLKFDIQGTVAGLSVIANEDLTFKLDVAAGDSTASITNGVVSLATEALANAALSAQNITDLNAAIAAAGIDALVLSGTAPAADVTSAAAITATGVVVEEVEQPWQLGLKSSDPIHYTISPRNITLADKSEAIWGDVTTLTSTTFVGNGKKTADMEYFYMGERADQYRNVGFPYVRQTIYQTDPTVDYHYIDIDYFYQGTGVDSHKSQKHITIAVPSVGADNSAQIALANTIIADINTATGASTLTALS